MKPDMFKQPVILGRSRFRAEVGSVMDAYPHLCEWPASLRNTAQLMALNGCGGAVRGGIEAETARGHFAAFAEKHDLLAPEIDTIAASHVGRDSDPQVWRGWPNLYDCGRGIEPGVTTVFSLPSAAYFGLFVTVASSFM